MTVDDDAPVIGEPEVLDSIITQTFDSGEVNVAIPVGGDGNEVTVTSTIDIAATGTIQDVNVSLDIQHSFLSDLEITLIAPDGTRIALIFDQGGRGGADGVITLDDEASLSFDTAFAPYAGVWRPTEDALSGLDGLEQAGTWTLEIFDDFLAEDGGELRSWSLEIESSSPVNAIVDEDDLLRANGDLTDGNADRQTGDADTVTDATLDADTDPTTVYGDLAISWGRTMPTASKTVARRSAMATARLRSPLMRLPVLKLPD